MDEDVSIEDYVEVQHQFGLNNVLEVIIKTIEYKVLFNVSYPVALEYTRQEYRFNEIKGANL